LSLGVAEVEYLVRRGPAAAANAIIYRQVIRAATENQSMSSENTNVRVLAGNLKLFTIDFRNRFDPAFASQSAPLVASVNKEVDSRGILSHIGEAAANTLVATVEGTAAVVGTMGEVVASEEFQRGLGQVAGEYQRQQEQVAQNNARMASLQAAAAREREAQAAAERAALRQRQAEQQVARAAQATYAQQQADNRQAAAQAAAAQRKAEAEALAARQAAEREARIARQEREARANAANQMRGFVASTAKATPAARVQPGRDPGSASRSANDSPAASKEASRGTARAWCMLKRDGDFWCNGPLQNGGWGKTLKRALEMVDCPDGHGYTPTVGTGGQSFNCGRELRKTEQEVPLYDPFYNRDKKY
jgi:flagellar biosynthesis GTPase FlhF